MQRTHPHLIRHEYTPRDATCQEKNEAIIRGDLRRLTHRIVVQRKNPPIRWVFMKRECYEFSRDRRSIVLKLQRPVYPGLRLYASTAHLTKLVEDDGDNNNYSDWNKLPVRRYTQ